MRNKLKDKKPLGDGNSLNHLRNFHLNIVFFDIRDQEAGHEAHDELGMSSAQPATSISSMRAHSALQMWCWPPKLATETQY